MDFYGWESQYLIDCSGKTYDYEFMVYYMGEMYCEIWYFITNLNLILFWRIVSQGFQGFQGPFRVMSITRIQPKVLIMVILFMILIYGLYMATECNNHRIPKIQEDLSPCTTATSSDNDWRDCFDTVFLWNYWKCHRYKKSWVTVESHVLPKSTLRADNMSTLNLRKFSWRLQYINL